MSRDERDARPARNERPDYQTRPARPARPDRPDRQARQGRSSGHPSRPGRPERQSYAQGQDRRRQPAQSLSEEIMQLDTDLFALLGRRSVLMNKLRKGKSHAASPGVVKSEKQIRSAWEQQAGRLSSSPRLSRQLFGLINELEINQERGEEYNPYNLSPSRQPVKVNTTGPTSITIGQLWLALAASSGLSTRLVCLPRSNPLIDTIRAFEQAGVGFVWDGDDLLLDGKNLPDYHGKTLFLGDDILTFYLFVFLGLREPGKLRFTGGPSLKEADLGALARFLPSLGARLVSVVPGTKGLPVNVECSGELPDELTIPADLPAEAVLALLLAALTWRNRISISLAEQPATLQGQIIDLAKRAFLIVPGLGQALKDSIDYTGYSVSDLDFPSEIKMPLDPTMCAAILALPIFTGGDTTLAGKWVCFYQADELNNVFKSFGLEVRGDDVAVSSTLLPDSTWPEALELERLSVALHPLFWALNARLAARAGKPIMVRRYPEGANLELAEDFLAQVGFNIEELEGGLLISAMEPAEFKTVASKTYGWPCPSWTWGLAMALGAFIRPNIKISNPDCVSKVFPHFWQLYNRLPSPQVGSAANIDGDAEAAAPSGSTRRRIKTDVVVEPEPREDFEGWD